MQFFKKALLFFILVTLTACVSTSKRYAPVHDAVHLQPIPKTGVYRVRKNDTIYSVAWRFGFDYRELAKRNQIAPPYRILVGQKIYLRAASPQSVVTRTSAAKVIPVKKIVEEKETMGPVTFWRWPANGPVLAGFSNRNQGINIGGQKGEPIYASALGKVVYSGSGLRGYGNLIIIKHNNVFLTAYAHNTKLFVREGQWVKAGQKIATMGNTGSRQVMLHFEIRRGGKSENPLEYLKR